MRAELEILGLDVSRHVVDTYATFLDELGATRSKDLLHRRSKAELLVAGVKVATQTPPIRSGRRVVFLTLDDGTGPVDATFFEDAQGPYAATVFGSWLLVVRGELRRTGRRGVSLRATGAWELPELHAIWRGHGMAAVHEHLARVPEGYAGVGVEQDGSGGQPGSRPQPGAGALQRLPDVAVRRRQAGRRGRQDRRPQAVAPQPGKPGMTVISGPLGWAPCRPASAAPACAPAWSGTPSWPGWSRDMPGPGRRHRRRHRRVRGPAGPGGPRRHRRRPESGRARGPRPARRRGRRRRSGHRCPG